MCLTLVSNIHIENWPLFSTIHIYSFIIHREQTKRHRLWFSTMSCTCYSTKTYKNSVILILKLDLTLMRNIIIHQKWSLLSTTHLLMRSQIQFQDEDHAVYISFHWVTTTLLRWEPQPVTLHLPRVIGNFSVHNLYLTSVLTGCSQQMAEMYIHKNIK